MTDAFIYDAIRTPRGEGKSSGALYEVKPIEMLSTTLEALRQRNELPTEEVDDVIIGCVTPINGQGFNIAKAGLLLAQWNERVSGMQINRYCASGLEAVNIAATKIRSGWENLIVAGGVESMSRVPIGSDGGPLIFDPAVINAVQYIPQGVSADLLASIEGFDRDAVDNYALQSHQRAAKAWTQGYFKKSIIPIYDKNGLLILDQDEHIRESSLESLSQLAPSFAKTGKEGFTAMALHKYPEVERIQYVHTAGNTSGNVDGAALILVGNTRTGKKLGLKKRAKIRSIANVSVEPTLMLTGAIPATERALRRAKMQVKDIDLWECNEGFAAVPLKFQKAFDLSSDILNVNGGTIAMGSPLGATGAMLLNTLLDEMERRDLETGLVTLCVGGGMGVATIIERV
ncbi:MAG: acetyl-CoA C-acetyltransferase [Saprospiraceae bacterium]